MSLNLKKRITSIHDIKFIVSPHVAYTMLILSMVNLLVESGALIYFQKIKFSFDSLLNVIESGGIESALFAMVMFNTVLAILAMYFLKHLAPTHDSNTSFSDDVKSSHR